jgi:O-antigen ligase
VESSGRCSANPQPEAPAHFTYYLSIIMFILLLVGITLVATVVGRVALHRWFNHLSLCSLICGFVLILFDGSLIGRLPILGTAWFYIFFGWLCLYLGSLATFLIRGLHVRKPGSTRAWEAKYVCRLPSGISSAPDSSRTGWGIFLLVVLQSVLLGASDEMDSGKLVFAAVYLLFLALWARRSWASVSAGHEPLLRWTAAVIGLGIFSRLPGMFSGIPTGDWVRDFMPLLHFSWILAGPFAFRSRTSIWRAYLMFVALVAVLSFVVTDQYLTIRQFRPESLGLIQYVRATDSVVLFGAFMAVPMTGLPVSPRYRAGFGLLAAVFIIATLLTGTRSHLGAILAGMVFYFWLTKGIEGRGIGAGRRAVLGSVLLGATAFGVVVVSGLLDTQQLMKRTEEMSRTDFGALTQRLDESLAAWSGFTESPIFGQGLGYRMPIGAWSIAPSDDDLFMIHNFYLYVLLKFGIIGVPIFAGFLVSMVRSAISTFRQARAPFDQAFSAGLASLIVALLVESATAPRFQDRSATALLSLSLACLLSLRRMIAVAPQAQEPVRASVAPHPFPSVTTSCAPEASPA